MHMYVRVVCRTSDLRYVVWHTCDVHWDCSSCMQSQLQHFHMCRGWVCDCSSWVSTLHWLLQISRSKFIASNAHCRTDMQCFARTLQIFVAMYVIIAFQKTHDVSTRASYHHSSYAATVGWSLCWWLWTLVSSARSHHQSLHSFRY